MGFARFKFYFYYEFIELFVIWIVESQITWGTEEVKIFTVNIWC